MQKWIAYLNERSLRHWMDLKGEAQKGEITRLELQVARYRIKELEEALSAIKSAREAVRL